MGGNLLKLILLYPLIMGNHIQVLWILPGVKVFSLMLLPKEAYPINQMKLAIWLKTLHHQIWKDPLTIYSLLMVLLVHLRDYLLKITSFLKWIDNCCFLLLWIYWIYLGFWMILSCILLIGRSYLPSYHQTFLSLMVDREKTQIIMTWNFISSVHPTPRWMTPLDYVFSNGLLRVRKPNCILNCHKDSSMTSTP